MSNKDRKRIIPRNRDFKLSGDRLEPYFKRLFRFVRSDGSVPVYKNVNLTFELFTEIWGLERHLVRLERILDVTFSGKHTDVTEITNETNYPETLLLRAFHIERENHATGKVVVNESLLREIHNSIQEAFDLEFPRTPVEFIPREAEEFYHRGNNRIFQAQYDKAIADFMQANELEPDNPVFEFAVASTATPMVMTI